MKVKHQLMKKAGPVSTTAINIHPEVQRPIVIIRNPYFTSSTIITANVYSVPAPIQHLPQTSEDGGYSASINPPQPQPALIFCYACDDTFPEDTVFSHCSNTGHKNRVKAFKKSNPEYLIECRLCSSKFARADNLKKHLKGQIHKQKSLKKEGFK